MEPKKDPKKIENQEPESGFDFDMSAIIPGMDTQKTEEQINTDLQKESSKKEETTETETETLKEKKRGRPPKKREETSEETEETEERIPTKEELEADLEKVIKSGKDSKKKDDEVSEESAVITPFVELLNEELGWGIKPEEMPSTVEELVEFMGGIIEENSKPKYHSEIVAQFDEYIKNGGDPRRFIEINYMIPDYENMELKTDAEKEKVVRDLYRTRGFKEEKIEKMIANLKANDELDSESEEAKSELSELTTKEKQALLKRQQDAAAAEELSFKQAITNTQKYIANAKDIAGIPITEEEKKSLLPYIYKRGKDGLTDQQREFQENPIEYAVTTAFLWKNRNAILEFINNESSTKGAVKFRQRMKEINLKSRRSADRGTDADADTEDFITQTSRKVVGQ